MTQLKHPIDLLGAVKSSSGIACALAKTKEGGLVSVIWNEDKKDKNESYFLEKVIITQLPKENLWIFEAEAAKKKKLGLSGKTVEKCLLFLQDIIIYYYY